MCTEPFLNFRTRVELYHGVTGLLKSGVSSHT